MTSEDYKSTSIRNVIATTIYLQQLWRRHTRKKLIFTGIINFLLLSGPLYAEQPIFDAHLHYNLEDVQQYPVDKVLSILSKAKVAKAVVTSRPPQQVLLLHQRAPSIIVPILGVYRTPEDKQKWMHDSTLPNRVEQQLAKGPWRGVGELHIFAKDRDSLVFTRVVELAAAHALPLLMHSDPAVIDAIFKHSPNVKVVWAHAGAYPFPPLLRDYLDRYPNLYIDLSVRDQRIAPMGKLSAEWELLLMEYSERFLVGVDTYRMQRWGNYHKVVKWTRKWLRQLPSEVSAAIGHKNGQRIFKLNEFDSTGAPLN